MVEVSIKNKGINASLTFFNHVNISLIFQIWHIFLLSVPVRSVVQALKETEKLDDTACESYEKVLRASQFVDQDREDVLALHHTALRIRADIQDSPSYNKCSSVNADDAAKIVPESLFMFLSVVYFWQASQKKQKLMPELGCYLLV